MKDFKMPLSYRIDKFFFPTFSIQWKIRSWISELIWPRQKWLTKKIPRSWCDKVELMREVMFEMIVHFVEEEMDIVSWDYDDDVAAGYVTQEQSDEKKKLAYEIRKLYHYIKHVRPALEKEIETSYPEHPLDIFNVDKENPREVNGIKIYDVIDVRTEEQKQDCAACYKKIHELEEQLDKQDQQALHQIVELRPILWT